MTAAGGRRHAEAGVGLSLHRLDLLEQRPVGARPQPPTGHVTGAREKLFLEPRVVRSMAGAPVERDIVIIRDNGIARIVG